MVYPLRLYNTKDLKIFSDSDQEYITYLTSLELAASTISTPGAITTSASGNTAIGSLTNTFYDQAIGTHPASALTIGSTTYNLYQVSNTTVSEDNANFRHPVFWDSDLSAVRELTSPELSELTQSVLQTIMLNEYPGTFRLASSLPSAQYSVFLSNVFADTSALDGSTTNYSIYIKTTQTAPVNSFRPIKIKRDGNLEDGSYQGLQVMSDDEIKATLGIRAKNIINTSGIGTYRIRSSAEGAPDEAGTWVARGTATDTRNTTSDVLYPELQSYGAALTADFTTSANYTGPAIAYNINYDVSTSATYSNNYTATETITNIYAGAPLSIVSYSTDTAVYEGVATSFYLQGITAFYQGDYYGAAYFLVTYSAAIPISYLGLVNYTSAGYTDYINSYTGTYYSVAAYESGTSYLGSGPFNYTQTIMYTTDVATNFTSVLTYTGPAYTSSNTITITNSYTTDYLIDPVYTSDTIYVGPGTSGYMNDYTPTYYTNDYTGGGVATNYSKNYSTIVPTTVYFAGLGPITDYVSGEAAYAGTISTDYTSATTTNYTAVYAGTISVNYTSAITTNYTTDTAVYAGTTTANYDVGIVGYYESDSAVYIPKYTGAGPISYLGLINYTSIGPINFSSSAFIAGAVYIAGDVYNGPAPANYTQTIQYGGPTAYNSAIAANYTVQNAYTGAAAYNSAIAANFTVQNAYTGADPNGISYGGPGATIANYTISYVGISGGSTLYSTQYTITPAFAGTTIDSITTNVETYTLYCRVL